jgi:hypothetical protein
MHQRNSNARLKHCSRLCPGGAALERASGKRSLEIPENRHTREKRALASQARSEHPLNSLLRHTLLRHTLLGHTLLRHTLLRHTDTSADASAQKDIVLRNHALEETSVLRNICSQKTLPSKTMHLGRHFGGGKNRAHHAGVGLAAVETSRGKLTATRVDRVLLRAAQRTMLR